MAFVYRQCILNSLFVNSKRFIFSSQRFPVKKITETIDGDTITVEAEIKPSDRVTSLLNVNDTHGACALCRLNLDLKYSDVLILHQFMRQDGTVLPRQVTGLCKKQQKKVERLVQFAHWAGLFSHFKPKSYNAEEERSGYKQYNRYFESENDMDQVSLKQKLGSFYVIRRYF